MAPVETGAPAVTVGPEARSPERSPAVGNDVVDLTEPRCRGKGRDERFLERVLAPPERDAVRSAEDRDLALWRRWAAKEAAFKTATAVRGAPPVFTHAGFVVEEHDPGGGVVRWEDLSIPWRIAGGRADGGIHVVAWWEDGPARPRVAGGTERKPADLRIPLERLLERFSERECAAVHSPRSAWVRLHARAHLASLLGIAEERLEIVCPRGPLGRVPPRILVDGGPSVWSVSLSHHGSLLGWVLARRPEEGEGGEAIVAPAVVPAGGS